MAAITEYLPVNLGSGPILVRKTFTYTEIAAVIGAATSGNLPLVTIPRGGKILGAYLKHTAQFTGVAGTFKISIGTSGSVTLYTAASADLVATAVSDTAITESTALWATGTFAAQAVVGNCVSSSGNISGLTAGQVDIYVYYMAQLPTIV